MRIAEIFLPEFEREVMRTRKVLELIPAEIMSWQLDEEFRSIGWNMNHLVEIVGWLKSIVEQSEWDLAPVDGPTYDTPSINDPVELLSHLDRNAAQAKTALLHASDESMAEEWSLKQAGQVLFTVSKAECLQTWVINHLVHHRAILTIYLRKCGIEGLPYYGM